MNLVDSSTHESGLARLSPERHPLLWVCGAHILLGLLLFDPKPFVGGDNFWYMLLGESLRSGQGYRDWWLPAAPAHTRFPPVYPLVLAAVGFISDSPIVFKLISLAFTTAIAAVVFKLAESRTRNRQLALFAGLLAASAPVLVEYSHYVLSEPLFVLLVTVSLYSVSTKRENPSRRTFAIGALSAVLASLTRTAGYPLLAAIALSLAVRRRWKRLLGLVVLTLILVGGWALRNRLMASGDLPYTQWMLFRDPYNPELGTVSLGELLFRLFENLKLYTLLVLPQSFGGRDLPNTIAFALGSLLATVIGVVALLRLRKLGTVEIFFVLYLGIVLLWPTAWADFRLLLPLVPIGIVLLFEGLDWGTRSMLRAGPNSLVFFGATTALIIFSLFAHLRIIGQELYCARQYWSGFHYACYPGTFSDFLESAIWMRDNTDTQAIAINRKPQMYYWYSRRRGEVYPFTTDADSLASFLDSKQATHIVVDSWSTTTFEYLLPAIEPMLDRFTVVYMKGDPPTFVLRYEREAEQ